MLLASLTWERIKSLSKILSTEINLEKSLVFAVLFGVWVTGSLFGYARGVPHTSRQDLAL